MSIAQNLLEAAQTLPEGQGFPLKELAEKWDSTPSAVHKMFREGQLVRLGRGLYGRPSADAPGEGIQRKAAATKKTAAPKAAAAPPKAADAAAEVPKSEVLLALGRALNVRGLRLLDDGSVELELVETGNGRAIRARVSALEPA